MITAVDSNVLLDILFADADFGLLSRRALDLCRSQGRLVGCEIIWAEVCGSLLPGSAGEAIARLGVDFDPVRQATALEAGSAWKSYRASGGQRSRMLADFIIGAHALLQADRLLTRDRGFYRRYFSKLEILDPSAQRR